MIGKVTVSVVLLLSIFCVGVGAGSGPDIQDGMWEITSAVKMQGMTIPPMTVSQCITKENAVPQSDSPGQGNDCKVTDTRTDGDTVSWTVVCSGQGGEMKGKGKITYHGDRFEGEVRTEAMGMVMITEMTGKRIGPCN